MSNWRALRGPMVCALAVHAWVLVSIEPLTPSPPTLGPLQTRWIAPPTTQPPSTVPSIQPSARTAARAAPLPIQTPPAAAETVNPSAAERAADAQPPATPSAAQSTNVSPVDALAAADAAKSEASPAAATGADTDTAAWTLPGSTRLVYDLRSGRNEAYLGTAELTWRHDGSRYEARLRAGNVLRERVQSSIGHIGSAGLNPERFTDKNRSESATHFERHATNPDAAMGRVIFSNNRPSLPITPRLQDRVSVWIQLAAQLAAGTPQIGQEWRVPTVGSAQAEDWVFRVRAAERLELPGGSLDTWKLDQQLRHEHDRRIELWVAPALQWLPARIRITQSNGDVLDQLWAKTAAP